MTTTRTSDHEWETALSAVLREQAPAVDGAPSLAGPAIHRAGRIRRRRHAGAAALTALVVAAVATPVALGTWGRDRATTTPGTSARPTASVSAAPSTAVATAKVTISAFSGLPKGSPVAVTWIEVTGTASSVIHLPGSREIAVDFVAIHAAPFGAGAIAAHFPYDTDGPYVVVVGTDGSELKRFLGQGPVASADGTRVAVWRYASNGDSPVEVFDATSGSLTPVFSTHPPELAQGGSRPVGFLDDETVVVAPLGEAPAAPNALVRESGVTLLPVFNTIWAVSEATRTITGLLADSPDGKFCSGVVAADAVAAPVWSTCTMSLRAFSPDGRYVAVGVAEGDGAGDAWIAVLDTTTWTEITRIEGLTMVQTVFEDDTHLLVTATDDAGRGGIVRCSVLGVCDVAIDVVAPDPPSAPVRLGAAR
jgi:hypothetical protein